MLFTEINCDPHACPEGATVTTGQLVAEVFQTAPEPQKSFEILLKLVTNAMANPSEPKFREVRKANNIVRSSIVSISPCATLLRRCGFVDRGEHFRLQGSGLRIGELSRLRVALAEQQLTKDLSASLNDSMLRHLNKEVLLNEPQERGAAQFADQFASPQEVAQAGLALARPGWTLFHNYDADAYQDAFAMSARNLEACLQLAEEKCFGGISMWEGQAYFRESTGAELKQRLIKSPGAAFYVYIPPYGTRVGSSSSSAAAPVAVPAPAPPLDEEDDPDLQEALRLSMTSS